MWTIETAFVLQLILSDCMNCELEHEVGELEVQHIPESAFGYSRKNISIGYEG